jgi:MFS family permease
VVSDDSRHPVGRPGPAHAGRAIASAIAVSSSGNLPVFLVAAVAVQMLATLGIGNTELGLAVGAFFGVAILTSVAAGRMVDVIGWRRGLWLVAGLAIVSLVTLAGFGGSYPGVLVGLGIGGLAFAGATPAANLAIASELPLHRHGFVLGLKQAAIPLSTFFAGLSVPAIALTVGWRWTFVAALILPILALLFLPRNTWRASEPPSRLTPRRKASTRIGTPRRPPVRGARELRWLGVAGALAAFSIGALNGFAVVSAVGAGISEGRAGLLIASAGALATVVRVVSGWYIDRSTDDGFRAVVALSVAGAFGYVGMAISTPVMMTVGVLLAFGAGWGWPGLFHYGLVRFFPDTTGHATGVIQTGFAAGTALGPLLFGILADATSYAVGWGVSAAVTLVSAVMIGVTSGRLRRVLSAG